MDILVLVLCLLVMRSSCSADTQLPYNVSCRNESTAIVTVATGYTLSTTHRSCSLTQLVGTIQRFLLDSNCLDNAQLVVERRPSNTIGKLLTSEDTHVFLIKCQKEYQEVYTVTKQIRFGANISPTQEVVTFTTDSYSPLRLLVLNRIPISSQSVQELEMHDLSSAQLGDALFLIIVDTRQSDALIIPRRLSVQKSTNTLSPGTVLWQLEEQSSCVKEPSIVKTNTFTAGQTTDLHVFSTLEIEAFKFADDKDADITFSCEVRVCRNVTGSCQADKSILEACGPRDNSGPPVGRRRREEDDETSHGEVHQVTATLRIVNDVIPNDSAGSKTATFTRPCLLLSLLVYVIM